MDGKKNTRVVWPGGSGSVRAEVTRQRKDSWTVSMSDETCGMSVTATHVRDAWRRALNGMLAYWNGTAYAQMFPAPVPCEGADPNHVCGTWCAS